MMRWHCFNPYRVFKFVATARVYPVGLDSMPWFQSLSGFQVRCNIERDGMKLCAIYVSIPIGFSSSLQPLFGVRLLLVHRCFNPYRVFKFVATAHPAPYHALGDMFQSLSGFQVRCNNA